MTQPSGCIQAGLARPALLINNETRLLFPGIVQALFEPAGRIVIYILLQDRVPPLYTITVCGYLVAQVLLHRGS